METKHTGFLKKHNGIWRFYTLVKNAKGILDRKYIFKNIVNTDLIIGEYQPVKVIETELFIKII